MKINNLSLLKTIFKMKGNLKKGVLPKIYDNRDVYITPFLNNAKSAVTISADFEMSWAFRAIDEKYRNEKAENSRNNVPFLINLFEIYNIPITWAIIGHLFLRECKLQKGRPHSDMHRPPKNLLWEGDWYLHDPCKNYKEEPYWYAPDLIEKIIKSNVNHEFGTHSFSHIDFSNKTTTRSLVYAELKKCIEVMNLFNIQPKSLVFPFNKMGYQFLDIFSELGLIAIRHRDENIRISYPERTKEGLYKIYESMNLRKTNYYDYEKKAKIFLEEAIKNNGVYHIWFHPSDPKDIFECELQKILKIITFFRDKGSVWVTTMKELAAFCEAREKIELSIEKRKGSIVIILDNTIDFEKYGDPNVTIKIKYNNISTKGYCVDGKGNHRNLAIEKNNGSKSYYITTVPSSTKKLVIKTL